MKTGQLYYKKDEQIRAPRLRVIGQDGKQLGILSKDEALSKARSLGLSLIEIAPAAKPPVAKIYDYGKFRYQEEKKLRKQKVRGGDIKEIRFSPFIAENDYRVRIERVKEFLDDRNKVRLVVVFKGRQMGSKSFGYSLLKRVVDELGDTITVDMQPKFLGKHLMMVVSPVGKRKIAKQNAETKNEKITG